MPNTDVIGEADHEKNHKGKRVCCGQEYACERLNDVRC